MSKKGLTLEEKVEYLERRQEYLIKKLKEYIIETDSLNDSMRVMDYIVTKHFPFRENHNLH